MSAPTIYVGIDPGAKGAIAMCCLEYGHRVFKLSAKLDDGRQPDIVLAHRLLTTHRAFGQPVVAYLEEVGGFIAGRPAPGSAMFNFGTGYGRIQGAFEALGLPYRLVRPQVWQKGISGVAGLQGKDRKRALCAEARRLYPDLNPTLETCDAILLMHYAKRHEA